MERNTSDAGTSELSAEELANLRGALYAEWAAAAVRPDESLILFATALNCLRAAVSGRRDYLIARCNLAYLLLSRGERREAAALLEAALQELEAGNVRPDQMAGLWYPRKIEFFGVSLERVWNEHKPGTDAWLDGILALVCGRICMTLAELRLHESAFPSALPFAASAVRYAPQWSESHYLHAHLLARNGRVEEALDAYRESLRRNPFFIAPREELVRLLLETGQKRLAREACTAWLAILDGCPPYESTRATFAALLFQACETQPEASQDCPPGGTGRTRPLIYC